MSIIKIEGMLDPHVHLRSMAWSHKGTFETETAAALAGGYWAVFDMPNTAPATLDPVALKQKTEEFSRQALCDFGVYFGASSTGNWDHYGDIAGKVCGLKIYNNETTGNLLIQDQRVREQHYQHWNSRKPVAVHAEDETVLDILELVRKYRKFTHFCHISTAREIEFLRAAKEEGLPISIGVTPHHLFLTEEDLPVLGALGLMKPTLKSPRDRNALWKAIDIGLVDIVESDHAPHTLAEKTSNTPPYGVPGLQTTLPLLLTAVQEGQLSIDRVTQLIAVNPQRIFGISCPPETFTLVEIDDSYVLERTHLRSLCGWSPFEGMRLFGRVIEVRIRGHVAFDGENVLVARGFGNNLYA